MFEVILGRSAGQVVRVLGRPCSFADGLTHLFPTREVLAQADLRAIGVPNDRVEAVRALARAFSAGRISFGTGAEAQQVVDALCRIRGVAASMAQWVAMRALREPDAFPSDDSPCSAAFNPSSLVVVLFAQALGPRECRAEEPYCL